MSFRPQKLPYLIFFLIILFGFKLFFISLVNNSQAENYTSTTSVTVLLVCGDGMKDTGEVCDGNDFGGQTCLDYGFLQGDLTCASDCYSITTGLCSTCNNGIKEGYEQCDISDYGGDTCLVYGYNSGTLSCAANCNVNIMNCASVGLTEPGTAGTQGGGPGGGGGGGGGGAGYPQGFQPGSDQAPKGTKVVISGKAYPGSDVNILIDGKVIGIVRADTKADFYFESNAVTPGVVGIGLWAEDNKGRKSALQTLTFRVASGAVTTVSGAYLSPSIDIDKPTVGKGEILKVFGTTAPDSEVQVYVHSSEEVISYASSTAKGEWNLNFNTSPLAEDEYHIVKATFEQKASKNVIKSGFSKAVSFYVGKGGTVAACGGADLNKDKKVNLVDFSILLYYWGTDNACADQNKNKKVDLIDFSIMLYNWTG